MSAPPPPPPPHGENPRSSGLPPGNYDIFIIPPHSSGSGFIYLPSLKPNVNSFAAGFASALILVAFGAMLAPAVQAWWNGLKGTGGMGMVMLIVAIAIGAWALGRTQNDGGIGGSGSGGIGGEGASHSHSNAHGTAGAGTGGYPGAGTRNSGPPPGSHHAPPPRDKPKSSWQQAPNSPPPGSQYTPPPQDEPKPSWQQEPNSPPPGSQHAPPPRDEPKPSWQQEPNAPPPGSQHAPPPPRDEPKPSWQQEHNSPPPNAQRAPPPPQDKPKPSWQQAPNPPPPEPKQAPPPQDKPKPSSQQPPNSPPPDTQKAPPQDKPKSSWQRPQSSPGATGATGATGTSGASGASTPKSGWEKAREETRKRQEEQKAKEAEKKRKEDLEKRLKEAREREAKEREAREKKEQEKKAAEKWAQAKKDMEKRIAEKRELEKKEAEKKAATEKRGTSYAFIAGEKTNPWPSGRPPAAAAPPPPTAPRSASSTPSPTKRPPAPTAKTYRDTEESEYSYRPYDKPKRKKSFETMYSESSYAASQSTARTTPPPSTRGAYSTKDPDKIVIKAVYSFNNAFMRTPTSQLVSGVGSVTDGLILRITTEGLFIDDDVRGVPQREWDVKAWTLKLVEVWCPTFTLSALQSKRSSRPNHMRRLWNIEKEKAAVNEEADALLLELLKTCRDSCRLRGASSLQSSYSSDDDTETLSSCSTQSKRADSKQTGDNRKGLHLLRANIRDQEGRRYVFVIGQEESWKVAVGLQRLRKGTQVRALGVSGMSAGDTKGILDHLGW